MLSLSHEEAQRLKHSHIGTEHLLLGLVREGEGVAAQVLKNLGVELAKVRSGVESIIGIGEHEVQGELGLTPRAKKVIMLAVEEAQYIAPTTFHCLIMRSIREAAEASAASLESSMTLALALSGSAAGCASPFQARSEGGRRGGDGGPLPSRCDEVGAGL